MTPLSEADKAKALEASYWDFIELGASHMITGYDHLLFLFGVIFFLTKDAKTLYVMLSDAGEVYDANYTGKFEGLKE